MTSRPSIGCCAIHSDTERRNVSDSVDKCLTSIDERYRDLELARRGVVGALDMVANGNSDRIEVGLGGDGVWLCVRGRGMCV